MQHALRDAFSGILQEMLEAEMDLTWAMRNTMTAIDRENLRSGHSKKRFAAYNSRGYRDRGGEFGAVNRQTKECRRHRGDPTVL
jgi:hypothetical protein